MLVFFRYRNGITSGYEINSLTLPEVVSFDGKGLGDDIGNVVLQHPYERFVVVEIKCLHVLDRNRLA